MEIETRQGIFHALSCVQRFKPIFTITCELCSNFSKSAIIHLIIAQVESIKMSVVGTVDKLN